MYRRVSVFLRMESMGINLGMFYSHFFLVSLNFSVNIDVSSIQMLTIRWLQSSAFRRKMIWIRFFRLWLSLETTRLQFNWSMSLRKFVWTFKMFFSLDKFYLVKNKKAINISSTLSNAHKIHFKKENSPSSTPFLFYFSLFFRVFNSSSLVVCFFFLLRWRWIDFFSSEFSFKFPQ